MIVAYVTEALATALTAGELRMRGLNYNHIALSRSKDSSFCLELEYKAGCVRVPA